MTTTTTARQINERTEAVRRFNRFYTKQIGVLQESLLDSGYSLTEVRVLYELAHSKQLTAKELGKELALDPGYLSRMLANFDKLKLVERTVSESDGRQTLLRLTRRGQAEVAQLEDGSRALVNEMLEKLAESEQKNLVRCMHSIESILTGGGDAAPAFILRPHQPGDMGWVVYRHAVLYGQDYGWNSEFESLVAEIVAKFINEFDSNRERCWIAERGTEIIGSVFLVKESDTVAKLRLLYVEPSARGLGVGARLVSECVNFARLVGYKKVTLWTHDIQHSARRIYERAGFKLVEEKPTHNFGHDLTAQTWELDLEKLTAL